MSDPGKADGEGPQAGAATAAAALATGGDVGPAADGRPRADGNTAATASAQPGQQAPPTHLEAIPLAVDIGWTMAVLSGELRPTLMATGPPVEDRLPTEHELPAGARMELESARLSAQLTRLRASLAAGYGPDVGLPEVDLADAAGAADRLEQANLGILTALARVGREYGVAYQLGRSLRDTADPPMRPDAGTGTDQVEITARAAEIMASSQWQPDRKDAEAESQARADFAARDALCAQLSRPRVSRLQEWLSTLVPYLPPDSAGVVSVSVGRWSDLVSTIFDPATPGNVRRFAATSQLSVARELAGSLLPQGDAWINLLTGAESARGLLTPEGLVAAGEAALGRTARIVKRIAVHYWFVLLILAGALAGVLYAASAYLGGAGRVWTQIAAVAGALGVTVKGISGAIARLSGDAEKPIFGLAEIDAMAWAVTAFPAGLKLNIRGVHSLRRSGIPPSGPMGRS